jgi:hypothetical protein
MRSVPETKSGAPPTIYTYVDYVFQPKWNIPYDWIGFLASLIKLVETYFLYTKGGFTLACICSITWLYFLVSGIFLRLWQLFTRRVGTLNIGDFDCGLDILTGSLPTVSVPGGQRKIFLGALESAQRSLPWRISWGIGALMTILSMIWTYLFLDQSSNSTVYVWAAFQGLWLLLRLLFYQTTSMVDPMATHGHKEWTWNKLTKAMKTRVLALTQALAKYQTYHHPRGLYSYREELFDTKTLIDLIERSGGPLNDGYPLGPEASTGDLVDMVTLGIIGDTTLASAAWIQGASLGGMDLYDSCLLFLEINGAVRALPATRVEADSVPSKIPKATHRLGTGAGV